MITEDLSDFNMQETDLELNRTVALREQIQEVNDRILFLTEKYVDINTSIWLRDNGTEIVDEDSNLHLLKTAIIREEKQLKRLTRLEANYTQWYK